MNKITTINDRQLKLLVNECIKRMGMIQEATFWRCWCEAQYRVGKAYSQPICNLMRDESTLRIGEFEKAWKVNLERRGWIK